MLLDLDLSLHLVIPYCRQSEGRPGELVSTSLSLEAQYQYILAWARGRNAGKIAPPVYDHDTTGRNLDRAGIHELLARVGPCVLIVVYKWDRFAREAHDQETVIRQIIALGGKIVSATEPSDRLGRGMFGLLAEEQSRQHSERLQSIFRTRARRGRHHGAAPYGYHRPHTRTIINSDGSEFSHPTGDIVPDPATAAIVLEIYERLAVGEPANQIALDLDARGIRSGRGAGWRFDGLLRLARKAIYTGHIQLRGELIRDEAGEPVRNPAYQLVPDDLWQRAQRQIASRAGIHRAKTDSSWLEGLVIHECGAPMYFLSRTYNARTRALVPRFSCSSLSARRPGCGLLPTLIVEHKLEARVVDCLERDLGGIISVDAALRRHLRAGRPSQASRTRQALLDRQGEAIRRHERAVQAWLADVVDLSQLEELRDRHQATLAEIDAEIAAMPTLVSRTDLETLRARLASIAEVFRQASPDARHAALVELGTVRFAEGRINLVYTPTIAAFIPRPHRTPPVGRKKS